MPKQQLPAAYEQELLRTWELLRQQPPDVQEAERARYNRLAASTGGLSGPLAADELGSTRVKFPQAQQLRDLYNKRIIGPLPPGAPAETRVVLRPGTGPDVAAHEDLHVAATRPEEQPVESASGGYLRTPATDAFARMSPRDRELWRIAKTLHNEADPHRPHDAAAKEKAALAAAERLRAEYDRRTDRHKNPQ